MKIVNAGVSSIIVYFADGISSKNATLIQSAYKSLKCANSPFIKEITPSYTSILVEFDMMKVDFIDAKSWVEKLLKDLKPLDLKHSNLVEIPVCYEENLDLDEVAKIHQLSPQEVIDIHTSTIYTVYALGFLPGFAFMGEVDSKIATPRLENPRQKVPKGAVAIADKQAAIYPKVSPGGWRVLGITPIELFSLEHLSYLNVGDRVKYKAISKEEFLSYEGQK